MTLALLHRPAVTMGGKLSLAREDITFSNISPELVRIEIAVWNDGPGRSLPTLAVVQSAPLGAFVPWWPLTALLVPELGPGESTVLRTETRQTSPAPLGPPDRILPR